MNKETELINALMRFETRIEINGAGATSDILDKALKQNIKIAYYLKSASVSHAGGYKIVFNVEYMNTDVSPSDIHIVSSGEDVQNLFCQYVGGYKTRLVLFAKPTIDVQKEYQKFSVTRAPFYSNFVGSKLTGAQLGGTSMAYYDFYLDYRIGKVKLAMMENETNAEIARIAKQLFLPGMDEEAKAFLAHNYLAYTINYEKKDDPSSLQESYTQSAYGALIKKKCVCQGYAEAFKRLMDYAGVPCDVVVGKVIPKVQPGSRSGSSDPNTYHAWNIVKLNNGQDNYHIDVTWDSAGPKVSYTYFGLKDSDLSEKRTWDRTLNATCNCSKSLLLEARRGVMRFKSQLLANGASVQILGY